MNKFDLIHTAVLIVAIFLGYAALEAVLSLLNIVMYLSDILASRMENPVYPILFESVVYIIAAIILIRNGRRIAGFILRSDRSEEPEAEIPDAFPVPAPRDALALHLLDIVIGVFLIYGAALLTNFIEKAIATRLGTASKIS